MRPRLLDLFCGQGGAAMGYHRAGFDIVGVDLARSAALHYPFPFHRGDALAYLAEHGAEFDAIHGSPPCKVHTRLGGVREAPPAMLFDMPTHTDLVGATRQLLNAAGRPWIIENVEGAPMPDAITLCGTMFDLGAICADGVYRQLRRHRLFESSHPIHPPGPCAHVGHAVGVYGNGGGRAGWHLSGYLADRDEAAAALGTEWMTRRGASQAIPPAYTEWLGVQLLDAVPARG